MSGAAEHTHWAGHSVCMLLADGADISVFSAKNQGKAAFVCMPMHHGMFSASARLSPEQARRLAEALCKAADAAEAAIDPPVHDTACDAGDPA